MASRAHTPGKCPFHDTTTGRKCVRFYTAQILHTCHLPGPWNLPDFSNSINHAEILRGINVVQPDHWSRQALSSTILPKTLSGDLVAVVLQPCNIFCCWLHHRYLLRHDLHLSTDFKELGCSHFKRRMLGPTGYLYIFRFSPDIHGPGTMRHANPHDKWTSDA